MNKNFDQGAAYEQVISDYLSNLDYPKEAVKIFLSLVAFGPSTLLQISKKSGIERTRLYRMVDKLIEEGLIEEVPAYKKRTIKAVDLTTIRTLVNEKKFQAAKLDDLYPEFSQAVKGISNLNTSNVNVVYYRGIEGMKQMIWHLTTVKDIYRTYSYRFWNDIIGDKFTLDLNTEFLKMKIKVRDLYSDQYIKYKQNWMKTHGKKPGGDWGFWNARYIPEKIVKINQNVDIYNDIVAYSYWDQDEIFGVEIQNQRVADMQKQIHDALWKMGKKIDDLDWANPEWKKK